MGITFRNIKGTALTHPEMDANLTSYYLSSSVLGSTITFYKSGSDGLVVTSSHNLADSDSQTLSILTDQLTISNGNTVTVPTGSDTLYTAGDGLTLTGTEFTNSAKDQTVELLGENIIVNGTYPSFQITGSINTNTEYTAGDGLTLTGTEFTNSAKDQTVELLGENITVNGTYPSFQITGSINTDTTYTASNGLILSGSTFLMSGTYSGSLNVTGDITAYSSSDRRLKDNITPISNPIEKIMSIGGYEYDWNTKSNKEGHDIGVIAQEIEKILPDIVKIRGDGYKAVNYERIVALLIEAVKDQQAQIDELKSRF